jgi:hypothetical protein
MTRLLVQLLLSLALFFAGPAGAAVKLYDASESNGMPGDNKQTSINVCPPVRLQLGVITGSTALLDDGTGTVTLTSLVMAEDRRTDFGPDALAPTFGPGAFVFIASNVTRETTAPNQSTTSGVGGHGPSGTGPGQSAEWGLLTGFVGTGSQFCVSSPVSICNQNGFAHGQTNLFLISSTTYDLGTWRFDGRGDMAAASWFIKRTSNGGLANTQAYLRGAFHGAALPALPLLGFGVLGVCLAVVGGRAARRSNEGAGSD